jgi:hypothetical protein
VVIETTVASESMPSMKLTALITPTIQSIEATEPRMPRWKFMPRSEISSKRKPNATSTSAAAPCTANFFGAFAPIRSSYTPRPTISEPLASTPKRYERFFVTSSAARAFAARRSSGKPKPKMMASPPRRGVATSCIFRSSGTSTRPMCDAPRRTIAVATYEVNALLMRRRIRGA